MGGSASDSHVLVVNLLLLEQKQRKAVNSSRAVSLGICSDRVFCRYLFCVCLTMSFACYCLCSDEGRTYVGFTVNLDRRLRQHNQELTGGARATHGRHWKRICSVVGFPTKQSALQFEWKWKRLTQKAKGKDAVQRRCEALFCLVNSEQSTANALPFSTYEAPLQVMSEADEVATWFRDKEMRYAVLVE